MRFCDKKGVLEKNQFFVISINARVAVNEITLYCRSLLRLQNPTLIFLDLIQNNRKGCKQINCTMWLAGIGHEHEILFSSIWIGFCSGEALLGIMGGGVQPCSPLKT